MAAVLACGDGASLSHRSAGALWRIVPRWVSPTEVTTPNRRDHPGLRIYQSHHRETTEQRGIPTTTPAQTLLDLADVLDDRALVRAVNEAYVHKLTTPQHLDTLLTRSPGRRTSRLTPHTTAATPTRSHLEDDFLRFIKRHRLPTPETNQRIAGHEVDFVWRTHNLVAELDGYKFHTTNCAFERDRERDADLLDAGFRTIRITHPRLERQAEREAERLRSLLR